MYNRISFNVWFPLIFVREFVYLSGLFRDRSSFNFTIGKGTPLHLIRSDLGATSLPPIGLGL